MKEAGLLKEEPVNMKVVNMKAVKVKFGKEDGCKGRLLKGEGCRCKEKNARGKMQY